MTDKLDAIIFGATGFTGKIVVENAVELYKDLKWGIAGRNQVKLAAILKEVGEKLKQPLHAIPIIIADVDDEKSIQKMAEKCKLVVNCCGPYLMYGEIVVKACIAAGTHHVDLSGEPQFIDGMQLKYNSLARKHNAYIVPTCGFDCIPADMGVVYAEQNFPGTLNSVEMFWENSIDYADKNNKTLLHHGTWHSAICATKSAMAILRLQRKLNVEKLPTLKPKLRLFPFIQRPKFLQSYFVPSLAADRAVVQRSQRLRYEFEQKRPVQFECYVGFRSLLLTCLLPFYALLLAMLAQFKFTRKMLLRSPHVFSFGILSHRGPSEANMTALNFSMTFRARGWAKGQSLSEPPQTELLTRVSGSNPFYGLTSVMLLLSGKTILSESHKMPTSGGVLPPGAAFANTSYIDELNKHGLKFEVLHKTT